MEIGLSRQAMEIGTYRQRKVDYRNVWSVSVEKKITVTRRLLYILELKALVSY